MTAAAIPEDARRAAIRIATEARARTSTTEGALLAQIADAVAALAFWAAEGEHDAITIDRALNPISTTNGHYRAGQIIARLEATADALTRISFAPKPSDITRAAHELRQAATALRGLMVGP